MLSDTFLTTTSSSHDGFNVGGSLLDVPFNIHGEPGCLWDSKPEVESHNTGNASKTDEQTPRWVKISDVGRSRRGEDSTLVSSSNDEGDKGGSYDMRLSMMSLPIVAKTESSPKLPHPCAAKTAAIILPRILVDANSEEMMALRG